MKREAPIVRFEPQHRARTQLKELIARLTRHLLAEEDRLNRRKRVRNRDDQKRFELAIEALCCNLLVAAMVGPDTRLSVPRSHGMMWGNGRYNAPVFSKQFIRAIDLLKELKFIAELTKGYRFSQKAKQATTIVPLSSLSAFLPLGRTSWTDFEYAALPELIILRAHKRKDGSDGSLINYSDTAKTRRLRRQVGEINATLKDAPISVNRDTGAAAVLDGEGQPIDPYRRALRRVFNNGKWNAGGRLFGGFWMNMRREDRFGLIRIGGEEIANVDFSSLFPRMAYARARAEQPAYDLYDIRGDKMHRDGWKVVMNALLFAEEPLTRWPTGASDEFPKRAKLKEVASAIRKQHAPIAHLFEKGLGFELMYLESEMLIAIVQALFKQGITALPLHDSVLVARSDAETAKAAMEAEFKHRTGALRAFIKIDIS